MNNYITHFKCLTKACGFTPELNNFVRDKILLCIKDVELNDKLYGENNLKFDRLIQIIGTYHHREALTLVSTCTFDINRLK